MIFYQFTDGEDDGVIKNVRSMTGVIATVVFCEISLPPRFRMIPTRCFYGSQFCITLPLQRTFRRPTAFRGGLVG